MAFKTLSPRHVEHIEEFAHVFDLRTTPGAGYCFICDASGKLLNKNPNAQANYADCMSGAVDVIDRGIRDLSRNVVMPEEKQSDCCRTWAHFSPHCGAWICDRCDNHDGLARCYCGWSASGGNGRAELAAFGENIDEDY